MGLLKRFEGKVAVVTGASAGIGEAIAEHLVKHGVIVAGLARGVEKIQTLSKQLYASSLAGKGKLHAFKCDLTNEDEIISTIKNVIKTLGPISILVNNAGISRNSQLIDGDAKCWKAIFDTNVLGLSIATRQVIQNMIENKTEGHIIHINSVGGHRVINFPGIEMYTASKFAVTALAECLRNEVNSKKLPIKVTSISPGYVKTNMAKTSGIADRMNSSIMPGLEPGEFAETVIYVLSTSPNVNISELIVEPTSANKM